MGTSNNRFRNVILRFNLLFLQKSEREPFSLPTYGVFMGVGAPIQTGFSRLWT